MRGQGAGRNRWPRQGGRDQGRQGRGGGARPRRGDPGHGHPRFHRPRPLDRGGVGDRRRALRVDHPRPLGEEASRDRHPDGWDGRRGGRRVRPRRAHQAPYRARGGDDEGVRDPTRGRRRHRRRRHRPGGRDAAEARRSRSRRGRDPDRDQPADRHLRPQGRRPRLEGDDRRQLALPPPRALRALRQVRRGPAGGDGEGEGPHLRQARRQHRHPRQRRRALHVDARRRRPGGRQAGQLPRCRRRLEGGSDRRRARGDHLGSERDRDPLQHLRRDHPLRRDRKGDHRGLEADRDHDAGRRPPRRDQLGGGLGAARRRPTSRTSTTRRRCSARPKRSSSWRCGR